MFNGWDTDVIIEDLKIAILWNGKWHYEKCNKKHSMKQVQNRDKIKIKEIKKCGYFLYIIKDLKGKNDEFVVEEFSKFLIFLGLVWRKSLNNSEYIGFSDKERMGIRKRILK